MLHIVADKQEPGGPVLTEGDTVGRVSGSPGLIAGVVFQERVHLQRGRARKKEEHRARHDVCADEIPAVLAAVHEGHVVDEPLVTGTETGLELVLGEGSRGGLVARLHAALGRLEKRCRLLHIGLLFSLSSQDLGSTQ
ncbi:hypothetical protein PG993_002520 [Apiospora rasikravindrae]|uniref:Uncharacterized protein n=1 Tax=Apiospora rasikravindrae TaxID=990691 RepID=A0ABR1TWV6_9PEZI